MTGKVGTIDKKTGKVNADIRGSSKTVSAPQNSPVASTQKATVNPITGFATHPGYAAAAAKTPGLTVEQFDASQKTGSNTKQSAPENIPDASQSLQANTPITQQAPGVNPITGMAIRPGFAAAAAQNPGLTTAQFDQGLAGKYKTGLASVAGTDAPQDTGAASAAVAGALPKDTPVNPVQTQLEADPGYQQLLQDQKEYKDVTNQRNTLTQEYSKLIKQAGIPEINTQLLNMSKVINGTEDDIRLEVQSADGFATNSQVMALASARNKTLIQNYNNLLDTKQMAMENVNTMIGLAEKDRTNAQQVLQQKIQFDQQIIEYRDKFVNNAKEGYNNVIKAVGYDGLYKSLLADPHSMALAEKTMGLAPGQLAGIATQEAQASSLDKKIKEAQLSNIYSEIDARNEANQPINGVDVKTMAKIQASPEYKTINGVLPALQALTDYKKAIDTYGGYEKYSGTGKGELAGTYGNAIAAWKTLAGLGALSGADFTLAENAVPETGFFQRNSTMKSKLDASIKNAISQAENLTKRLQQNYPIATDNLETQLDYMKVKAYPETYKVGADGQVYEITN